MEKLSQMINKWSEKRREDATKLLQQFGDVDEMIAYIDDMKNYHQIHDDIYMIDDKFYVHYNKKFLTVYSVDSILFCYQSMGQHIPHNSIAGLIFKDCVTVEFSTYDADQLQELCDFFCKFLPDIENQPFSPDSFEAVGLFRSIKVCNGKFVFYKKYKPLFSKSEKEKIYYETDISNLIWCYQTHYIPDEGTHSVDVVMAFRDGTFKNLQISCYDIPLGCTEAFSVILNLRKNVPHLLYGINKNYKKIFKKNPEELFKIAMQKCRNTKLKSTLPSFGNADSL